MNFKLKIDAIAMNDYIQAPETGRDTERYMYIRKIERDKDTNIKKEKRRDRGTG